MGLSPIEWTDGVWNPCGGCSLASPGCRFCYAQTLAGTRLKNHRLYAGTTCAAKTGPVFNGTLTVAPDDHPVWLWPLRWRGAPAAKAEGRPSRIFVGDMSDLFHEGRPLPVIMRVLAAAVLARRHILQLLTKRPEIMRLVLTAPDLAEHLAAAIADYPGVLASPWTARRVAELLPLQNVWAGVSVEDQVRAEERREPMAAIAEQGWTTFVSYEPAIGPVDWTGWEFLAQLIAGGESGPRARVPDPDGFRAARDFCAHAGVAFLFKQWGEYAPAADGRMVRLGKKVAGRLLDGRLHHEFPNARELAHVA